MNMNKMEYKHNCFRCDGMQEHRKCYETLDKSCLWRKIADNDLEKYGTGEGCITLKTMLHDYIKENTKFITQKEVDEILKSA